MDPEKISKLLYRYINGELDEAACRELEVWRRESARNEALFQKVVAPGYFAGNREKSLLSGQENKKEWEKLEQRLFPKKQLKMGRMLRYAAILVLPLVICLFLLKRGDIIPMAEKDTNETGSSVPMLTLSDGTVVNLDESSGNEVHLGEQLKAEKYGDTIRYRVQDGQETGLQYNTLTMLSDGTVVYLNSASSLRYPVSFGGDRREVTLTGEGYFDVKHDAGRPFIVKAGEAEIRVLGTSFGIRAYEDENEVLATLVEGFVNVRQDNSEVFLKPSQQAVCRPGSAHIEVQTVNVDYYVGWKSGRFIFNDMRLEDIINRIQKWYDFEVFFENADMKNIPFSVNIIKYEDYAKFFKALERTESVRFEIKGRTVVVKR